MKEGSYTTMKLRVQLTPPSRSISLFSQQQHTGVFTTDAHRIPVDMARSVLITGCSAGGLGAALAMAYHRCKDYRAFATARTPGKMISLAAVGVTTLSLDVSSDESVTACAKEIAGLPGGSLDVLIDNAGGGYNMPLLNAPLQEMSNQFNLHVLSVLRAT